MACYHWVKKLLHSAFFHTLFVHLEKLLMKHIIYIFCICFFAVSLAAQDNAPSGAAATIEEVSKTEVKTSTTETEAEEKKENIWKTLSRITYRKEYDELMGFKIDKPVFSQQVKDIENVEVTIKGYVIPVEGYKSHTEFIFSAFPYNMCFFCGGAGPETVMEVLANEPIKYSAEQITIKGKLQLNADDINRLMYQLVDATLVK